MSLTDSSLSRMPVNFANSCSFFTNVAFIYILRSILMQTFKLGRKTFTHMASFSSDRKEILSSYSGKKKKKKEKRRNEGNVFTYAANLTFSTRYYHSVVEGHTLKSISSGGANEPIMTVMSFATTMI